MVFFLKNKKVNSIKTSKEKFFGLECKIKFFFEQISDIVWISFKRLTKDCIYIFSFIFILLIYFYIVDLLLNYLLKFFN